MTEFLNLVLISVVAILGLISIALAILCLKNNNNRKWGKWLGFFFFLAVGLASLVGYVGYVLDDNLVKLPWITGAVGILFLVGFLIAKRKNYDDSIVRYAAAVVALMLVLTLGGLIRNFLVKHPRPAPTPTHTATPTSEATKPTPPKLKLYHSINPEIFYHLDRGISNIGKEPYSVKVFNGSKLRFSRVGEKPVCISIDTTKSARSTGKPAIQQSKPSDFHFTLWRVVLIIIGLALLIAAIILLRTGQRQNLSNRLRRLVGFIVLLGAILILCLSIKLVNPKLWQRLSSRPGQQTQLKNPDSSFVEKEKRWWETKTYTFDSLIAYMREAERNRQQILDMPWGDNNPFHSLPLIAQEQAGGLGFFWNGNEESIRVTWESGCFILSAKNDTSFYLTLKPNEQVHFHVVGLSSGRSGTKTIHARQPGHSRKFRFDNDNREYDWYAWAGSPPPLVSQ